MATEADGVTYFKVAYYPRIRQEGLRKTAKTIRVRLNARTLPLPQLFGLPEEVEHFLKGRQNAVYMINLLYITLFDILSAEYAVVCCKVI